MQALEPDDPRSLGRLRILARIGAGGMAVIYFGRSGSGRRVAVKAMHGEFAAAREYRERFRREVAATRAVAGRYSPGVVDADPDAAVPWLATQFLPAVSLREAVGMLGRFPEELLLPLSAGLAEALMSIHRAGIVHLDLKPANVLLTADGPRVIDFGIAAELRPGAPGPLVAEPAGTWGFMAPEQASVGPVGPAADVFSFGATLAYACTGRSAPDGGLEGITDEGLQALIRTCLHPDPSARPAVPDLSAALSSLMAADPSAAVRLPPKVSAEIDRRASEAENPPVALPWTPEPRGRAMSRRALLFAGGVLPVAGAAAALPVLLRDDEDEDDHPETIRVGPGVTPSSPRAALPAASGGTSATRTLEFYFFGTTTLKSLTTTVNGQSVTVRNRRLPYRRTVQIPRERTTWRIAYRFAAGTLVSKVIVDGAELSGMQGFSAGGKDLTDSHKGTV